MSVFEEMLARYENGTVPWDAESPPPEVIEWVEQRPPGKALDLGCGFGRSSIFLAQHHWQVDAVDFIPQAIAEAISRAGAAGVTSQINFHVASVAELGFLKGLYDFAVDVGCLHALDQNERRSYHKGLSRLLRPGATYLLFTRLQELKDDAGEAPRGLPETTVREIFGNGFQLERIEQGQTQVEDRPSWTSAWFWFRRCPGFRS